MGTARFKIIIATNNRDKLAEIKGILEKADIEVLGAADFPDFPEAEETGETLAENALQKARAVWKKYRIPCLADDTGLEVDYLDGEPGVYSSRYAGPEATYDDNCEKLLADLEGVPRSSRKARFRTVMAFIDGGGREHLAEGSIEGAILERRQGKNGFGYDPIFFVPAANMTLAEMTAEQKNSISHRRRALDKIIPVIKGYFLSRSDSSGNMRL